MIDLQVLHFHPHAESLLDLEQQLYHPNGVEPRRRHEVGVGGRHFHVEHAVEQVGEFGLHGAGRGHRAAPTVSSANNTFSQSARHVSPRKTAHERLNTCASLQETGKRRAALHAERPLGTVLTRRTTATPTHLSNARGVDATPCPRRARANPSRTLLAMPSSGS